MRVVHDDGFVRVTGAVALVVRQVLLLGAGAIAEMRVVPDEVAAEILAVGIDQQFVRIEPMANLRSIGPMYPVAVKLPRTDIRKVAVPDVIAQFRQNEAPRLMLSGAVEQAQFDLRRVG